MNVVISYQDFQSRTGIELISKQDTVIPIYVRWVPVRGILSRAVGIVLPRVASSFPRHLYLRNVPIWYLFPIVWTVSRQVKYGSMVRFETLIICTANQSSNRRIKCVKRRYIFLEYKMLFSSELILIELPYCQFKRNLRGNQQIFYIKAAIGQLNHYKSTGENISIKALSETHLQ